jgi:fumarylpyruvate hydrolase
MTAAKGWLFDPLPRAAVSVAGEQRKFPVHRIYCVGQNYRAHAREMGDSGREPPFFFAKPADAICQAASLPYPPLTRQLHHEVELVVAIGTGGSAIPVERALEHVYGYAVGVDLTRRDLQTASKKAGRPWTTSKGFDHSAPVSALQPVSRVGHPLAAEMILEVNGEVRQRGSTADMTWSVPEIIAELSGYFELRAGDLIFTGTPPGVGSLAPGDRVTCRIAGIGQLEFEVSAK